MTKSHFLFMCLLSQFKLSAEPMGCAKDFLIGGRSFIAPDSSIALGWPGNSIEGVFTGSTLKLYLQDGFGDYNITIDGMAYPTLITKKSQVEYLITDGLDEGEHHFRLARRTEGGVSYFLGVQLSEGSQLLPPPQPKPSRIEFLGDSYTVGYGLESESVRCNNSTIKATTNHDLAFPSLVSQYFQADFHSIAMSGLGLVRNYAGKGNQNNFRYFFPRSVMALSEPKWNLSQWKPQLVVIGLGINDFSTKLNSTEGFDDFENFVILWKQAYHQLLDELRQSYGDIPFILTAVPFAKGEQLKFVEEVVQEENLLGYNQIYFVPLPRPKGDACQAHPGKDDHYQFAQTLIAAIESINILQTQLKSPIFQYNYQINHSMASENVMEIDK